MPRNSRRLCRAVRRAAIAAVLALLTGCAETPSPGTPYTCLVAGERRMLVAELFFGRAIHGRAPLSEAEWQDFAAHTLTANFPDGFTVTDGEGQWRNPATGGIATEATKIVTVAALRSPDLAPRLAAVMTDYKTRFHQQSVGLITRDSCAAF